MKKYFLSLLTVLSVGAFAQHNHEQCAFDHMHETLLQEESYRQSIEQLETIMSQPPNIEGQTSVVRTIPVVVHVVYATQADNISVRQIEDAIRVINEDFRRLNADTSLTRSLWDGIAVDTEIEFALAKRDPQGNCTDGITRTQSNQSLTGTPTVKNVVGWDNKRYMNIWVCRHVANTTPADGGYVLGYANFPQAGANGIRNSINQDGIVIRHDEMGTIGTAAGNPRDGRTLTHEIGHYLALYHPFQGGCSGQGDRVSDTPPVAAANDGCNFNTNTCSTDNPDLLDQIENYMDYTECQNMFSDGQKARMVNVLTNSTLRAQLVSGTNAASTGLVNAPICTPDAKLEGERSIVCTGDSIQFFDISEEGDPTSWQWSFPGGSPSSSTAENPVVYYNTPGKYDVFLQVTNSAGTDTIRLEDYVSVKNSDAPFFNITWTQSFENGTFPLTMTAVDGGDGNTFKIYNGAGSHQNNSLILEDAPNSLSEIDELISPAISTAGGSNLNLFFDYAYAAKQQDNTDRLEVFVSRDCGLTWTRRRFYTSGRMRTAANTTGNYVPAPGDWRTETIGFDAFIQNDPILIKFTFENGGGNNFYIDNIRFGQGTDVGLEELSRADFKLYPNPTQGQVQLRLSGIADQQVNLEITDLSGKLVESRTLQIEAGRLEQSLDLSLTPGVYLVRLKSDRHQFQSKLQIQ